MTIKIEYETRNFLGRKTRTLKPGEKIGLGYKQPSTDLEAWEADFFDREANQYGQVVEVLPPDKKTKKDKVSVESATDVRILSGDEINQAKLSGTTKRFNMLGGFTVEEVTIVSQHSLRQRARSLLHKG